MITVSSRTQQSEQTIQDNAVTEQHCDEVENVARFNIVHGVGVLVD